MAPDGTELVGSHYGLKNNVGRDVQEDHQASPILRLAKDISELGAACLGNSAPIAMNHYAMKMQSWFERAIVQENRGIRPNVPSNSPFAIAINGGHRHRSEPGNC